MLVDWFRSFFYEKKGKLHGCTVDYLYGIYSVIMWFWVLIKRGVTVLVFDATFNHISVISWRSVLLVEKSGIPGENHRLKTLLHNVVSSTPRLSGIQTPTLVVICTDYIGSCKSNYHTFTTMMDPIMRSNKL